jgi:uncharacterized RDD family membrane protein YckC
VALRLNVPPKERPIVQLDNTVEVETPEHVRFRFHVAGPTRRAWAYFVDLLVRIAAFLAIEMVMLLATGQHLPISRSIVSSGTLLSLFLIEWGYFVVFEAGWNGTTPGKRALRLRVVKTGGYPLSLADAILRNLLRTADFLPVGYLLGLLVMSWDGRFCRLGDRAAGTMVVIEDPVRVAPAIALHPPASEAELEALPQHPTLTPAEREAIELLLRRHDLSPARRIELAEMLAPLVARRLKLRTGDPVRFLALLHHIAVGAQAPKADAGSGAAT